MKPNGMIEKPPEAESSPPLKEEGYYRTRLDTERMKKTCTVLSFHARAF